MKKTYKLSVIFQKSTMSICSTENDIINQGYKSIGVCSLLSMHKSESSVFMVRMITNGNNSCMKLI